MTHEHPTQEHSGKIKTDHKCRACNGDVYKYPLLEFVSLLPGVPSRDRMICEDCGREWFEER